MASNGLNCNTVGKKHPNPGTPYTKHVVVGWEIAYHFLFWLQPSIHVVNLKRIIFPQKRDIKRNWLVSGRTIRKAKGGVQQTSQGLIGVPDTDKNLNNQLSQTAWSSSHNHHHQHFLTHLHDLQWIYSRVRLLQRYHDARIIINYLLVPLLLVVVCQEWDATLGLYLVTTHIRMFLWCTFHEYWEQMSDQCMVESWYFCCNLLNILFFLGNWYPVDSALCIEYIRYNLACQNWIAGRPCLCWKKHIYAFCGFKSASNNNISWIITLNRTRSLAPPTPICSVAWEKQERSTYCATNTYEK